MSNQKFTAIIFLLLTIIISLALSGLTILINDKKATIPNIPEGFASSGLDKNGIPAADVNEPIGKSGGPVHEKLAESSIPSKLGDPIIMKPMSISSENIIIGASVENQYGTFAKPTQVISTSDSAKQSNKSVTSSDKSPESIFNRIFDLFGNGSNKPEAFSLKH